MTKEQFKEYICKQIDLMSDNQLREFSSFLKEDSQEEHIAQELIIIKGEFKKLTKLVSSMESKIDDNNYLKIEEDIALFIEFDAFLQNSKDALLSLPKASLFNRKKVNRAIESIQSGFETIDEKYEKLLNQIGLMKVSKIGDKFDSNFHEVVDVIEDKKIEDGTVVEVLEEGFIYNDKMINYAKVKVNRWTL